MFPTVATFPSLQPHRLYSTHDSLPYDVHDPNFSTRDLSKPFFNPPDRSRLQLPHPVQRLDPRDASGSSSTANVTGEHALRRKTPNGTLAAGYDGTPGDTTIQPATKHLLVSPIDSGQFIPAQPGLPTDSWQQPARDQSSGAKHLNFPPVFKNEAGNAIAAGEVVQDANGTSWVRPVNYPPGIDSVLNQSLPLQGPQRYMLHNGAYVPTVLPATLQQCVGPTASAGTGPFGPYWPDGVYIPYRPAAFRDSRFGSPNPTGPPYFDIPPSAFNQPQMPLGSRADSGFAWNQSQPGMPTQDPMMKTHFPPRHSDQLPFHARVNRPASAYASPLNNEPMSWTGRPGPGFQNPGPAVASHAEFKEKILSWAHGVYVDLLATIHHARRNSISNGGADGQAQRLLKPSIYPKPPRQPGVDFSQNPPSELHRHNSYPSSQYDMQRQKLGMMSASNNPSLGRGGSHHRRPSLGQFPQQHRGSDARMMDAGRFTGAPPTSRTSPSLLNEGSPVTNAMSALEMLSHLCMESHWEWIDGMLLGGCLAYGLGDYQKALRWYSRIIARDSA